MMARSDLTLQDMSYCLTFSAPSLSERGNERAAGKFGLQS